MIAPKRFAAIVATASLLVTASPAFARHAYDDAAHTNVSTNAEAHAEFKAALERCKLLTGMAAIECRQQAQVEYKAGVKANANVHVNRGQMVKSVIQELRSTMDYTRAKLTMLRAKVKKSIEHSLNKLGNFTKRVCENEHDDETSVRNCVSEVKASISAEIDAMINVAFGS